MKVILKDGSKYDVDSDLAQHGLQIVGSKSSTKGFWQGAQAAVQSAIPGKPFETESYRDFEVADKDGKKTKIDLYSYLRAKNISVDEKATFENIKEAQQLRNEAGERRGIEDRKKQLESDFKKDPGEYKAKVWMPYSMELAQSERTKKGMGKLETAARFGGAFGLDLLSGLARVPVGLIDQGLYAASGGEMGQPFDQTMSKPPSFGPDEKIQDETTGEMRDPTVSENFAQIKEAFLMDPARVAKDLAHESGTDAMSGLMVASYLTGGLTNIAAPEMATGRGAMIASKLASLYRKTSKVNQAAKANAVVAKVSEKMAKLGVSGKLANGVLKKSGEFVEGGAFGGVQGVFSNWAMGSDKNAFTTFVNEAVEEGAFDVGLSSLGGLAKNSYWMALDKLAKIKALKKAGEESSSNQKLIEGKISKEEAVKEALLNNLPQSQEEADALNEQSLNEVNQFRDELNTQFPIDTKGMIPLTQEATTPVPQVVPGDNNNTIVNGQAIPVSSNLPVDVSRSDAIEKHKNPNFVSATEKAQEKKQSKIKSDIKNDINKIKAANIAHIKETEKILENTFKESVTELDKEEKTALDAAQSQGKEYAKSVNAILDPTITTSYNDWDKVFGAIHETVDDKRKAFEEFHVKEAKKTQEIKNKINPPKDAEGRTVKTEKAPDVFSTGTEKPKLFNAERTVELEEKIKAKLMQTAPSQEAAGFLQDGLSSGKVSIKAIGADESATGLASPNEAAQTETPPIATDVQPAPTIEPEPEATVIPMPQKPVRRSGSEYKKTQQDRIQEAIKKGPIQVFDETKLDDLKSRLDAITRRNMNRLSANPMFDFESHLLMLEIGGIYVQKGVNNAIDWADKMASELGENVRPYLNSVWDAIKSHPANTQFDPDLMSSIFEYSGIIMEEKGDNYSKPVLLSELQKKFGDGVIPYVDAVFSSLESYPREIANEGSTANPNGNGTTGLSETPGQGADEVSTEGDDRGNGRAEPRNGSAGRNVNEPADESARDVALEGTTDEKQGSKPVGAMSKNIDLTHLKPVELTPAKRIAANEAAVKVLDRVWIDPASMTESDRNILRQYTGLGGLDNNKSGATAENVHGMRYQHYTSYQVVQAVWKMIEAIGFNSTKRGLTALEPTAGIGNFIGFSPRQIKWRANEVDNIGAKIMKMLYPANELNVNGAFESYTGPKVDMVVTNVPFLNGRGRFEHLEKDSAYKSINSLHNYIIMKSIDNLRDNGIGVFLTSTGTMDSKSATEFRKQLSQKAEVVTAVRLPEGAFKKNTQYEGTVDLIVFRKRTTGEMQNPVEDRIQKEFVETREVNFKTDSGFEGKANRSAWYEKNPDLVMGKWVYGNNVGASQTGVAVEVPIGGTFEKVLDEQFVLMRNNTKVMGAYKAQEGAQDDSQLKAYGESAGDAAMTTPMNGLEVKNGKVYRRAVDGQLYPFRPAKPPKGKEWNIPDSAYVIITEIMQLSDNLLSAIQSNSGLKFIQDEIKIRLDRWKELDFKGKEKSMINGVVTSLLPGVTKKPKTEILRFEDKNLELWLDQDQRWPRVRALYNSRLDGYSSNLTTKVGIQKPPVVAKGNAKSGADVTKYLMERWGQFSHEKARNEFEGTDAEFKTEMSKVPELNWDGDRFVHDNDFLTGNLWPKIDYAKDNNHAKELKKLEKALPEQKTWENVEAAPQSTWWSPDALSEFARSSGLNLGRGQYIARTVDEEGKMQFRINFFGDKGAINGSSIVRGGFSLENFVDIILNQKPAKKEIEFADDVKIVVDSEMTMALTKQWKERFEIWSRTDGKRHAEQAAVKFNRSYAGLSVEKNSEEKLFIDGLATTINGKQLKAYGHQYGAVRWARTLRAGIAAWGVGYGKTLGAIFQFAALKSDGVVKKGLFVVPEKTMYMWRDNFYEMMPGTRVKVIRGDKEITRLPDMMDAAANDYDVIIIGHNAFTTIPLKSAELYIQEDIKLHSEKLKLLANEKASKSGKRQGSNAIVKRLEAKVDKLSSKLNTIKEQTLDPRIVSFEAWNIDAIWADEAHNYKNYFDILHEYADKQFLNTGKDSDIGNDFAYKSRYMHEQNQKGGVFLLSATPTPNKPIEIYKMLKLVAPWRLQEAGMETMDDFVRNFIDIGYANSTGLDGVTGDPKEMVLGYRNLKALRDLVKGFVDIRLKPSEEVAKLRPNGNYKQVFTEMSDVQMFGMAKVVTLSNMDNNSLKDIGYDMLTLTSEARMLAVDPARVYPELLKEEPDFTKRSSKLAKTMQNVAEHYKKNDRLQLIFLDEFKIRDIVPMLDASGNKVVWPDGFGSWETKNGTVGTPQFAHRIEDSDQKTRLLSKMTKTPDLQNWGLTKRDGSLFIPKSSQDMADFRPIFGDDGQIYVAKREIVEDLHQRIAEHAAAKIGIPAERIAVVNGEQNSTSKEKRAIEERVERKELSLIIGNRKALGEGMNLQTNGDAIHQVDVPWNPTSLIQSDGRFIRARTDENDKFPITIYNYGNIGSLDAFMYELNEKKTKWNDELWTGDQDVMSNELNNTEEEGADHKKMKEALQVDKTYVAGYGTYSAVQTAKKKNHNAAKERVQVENDIRRYLEKIDHSNEMISNAKERIEKREEAFKEAMEKWEEKVKTNPEAKKPEEPLHDRDIEIMTRHNTEIKQVQDILEKTKEKLAAFDKVNWETTVIEKSELMVADAKKNKFASIGQKLREKSDKLKNDAQGDKESLLNDAKKKIDEEISAWSFFLNKTLPDIYVKFAHLADMVATAALGNKKPAELDANAEQKVQKYAEKFSGQAGAISGKAMGMFLGAGISGSFLAAGRWDLAGYSAMASLSPALFYGLKRVSGSKLAADIGGNIQTRLSQMAGFNAIESRFAQTYLDWKPKLAKDIEGLEIALGPIKSVEDRIKVKYLIENVDDISSMNIDPKIKRAAIMLRQMFARIAIEMQNAGFEIPVNLKYFPRVFNWDKVIEMKNFQSDLWTRTVDHLMNNEGMTGPEAAVYLRHHFDNTDQARGEDIRKMRHDVNVWIKNKYPDLTNEQFVALYEKIKMKYGSHLPGNMKRRKGPKLLDEVYINDPQDILTKYFTDMRKYLSYQKVFGKNMGMLNEWLDTLGRNRKGERSDERRKAEEYINAELWGKDLKGLLSEYDLVKNASANIRVFQTFTKLFSSALAGVRNITSAVSTSVPVMGWWNTMGGMARVFSHPVNGVSDARNAGAIAAQVLHDATGATEGKHNSFLNKAIQLHPGKYLFSATDQFVRSFAFHAGIMQARDLFAKAQNDNQGEAIKMLRYYLGSSIDADLVSGELSVENAEKMGLMFSEEIGGSSRAFKTHPIFLTPLGKLATQFKKQAYQQTAVIYKAVYLPATKGNFIPLISWCAAMGINGYAVNMLASMLYGTKEEEDEEKKNLALQLLMYANAVNGTGVVGDMAEAALSDKDFSKNQLIMGLVGGPTFGTAMNLSLSGAKLFSAAQERTSGEDIEESNRKAGNIVKSFVRKEIPLTNMVSKWDFELSDILKNTPAENTSGFESLNIPGMKGF